MTLKFSVTKNGVPLDPALYSWNEKTRTFLSEEEGLLLDFSGLNNCAFATGSDCTFNTGSDCTFNTGSYCNFNTGSRCYFSTGSYCAYNTGTDCSFYTRSYCNFNTGSDCTFNTGSDCTFTTGSDCTFTTGSDCTFNTGSYCNFNTGSKCNIDTGENSVIFRRDTLEIIRIHSKSIYQLPPYNIKGYIRDGFYYVDNKKKYKVIIADGILSEIISKKRKNDLIIYKVRNYGKENESYLIQDNNIFSHGVTIKEAKEDLKYKFQNRDLSAYKDFNLDTIVTLEEAIQLYHDITGACSNGIKYFIENVLKTKKKKYTIKECIKLTQYQYGWEKFNEFFNKNDMTQKK